ACLGQTPYPPQPRPAVFHIRVTHVEGASHAGNCDPASRRFAADPLGQSRRNLIGHLRQIGACHAHLHTGEPTGSSRIQPRFERPRDERGGEQDADLWGLGLHGLYPILPASGPDRDGPGQVKEITSATTAVVSRTGLEPHYRNFHFGLRVVLSIHPAAFLISCESRSLSRSSSVSGLRPRKAELSSSDRH